MKSLAGKSGSGKAPVKKAQPKKAPAVDAAPLPPPIEGPFVVGAVAGATPGKWIDAWHERLPDVPLDLRPITTGEQRSLLLDGELHAALIRLLLLPVLLRLTGRAAWATPRWLRKVLPTVTFSH